MACVASFWINEASGFLDKLNFDDMLGAELGHISRRFRYMLKKIHLTEEEFSLLAAMVLFQTGQLTTYIRLETTWRGRSSQIVDCY